MPTKENYYKLKQEGRCVCCGKVIIGERKGMIHCENCAKKENERRKIIYYENKEYCEKHKICPICHKNKILGDEKRCPECRANKYNSYSLRISMDPEYHKHRLEISKKSDEKRIAYRKANNLCSRCGKELTEADKGFVNCKKCRVRNMLRGRKYRANKLIVKE